MTGNHRANGNYYYRNRNQPYKKMTKFSQRIGKTLTKSVIQKDDIDSDLANALWNGLSMCYWDLIVEDWISSNPNEVQILITRIWIHYFKNRIDEKPRSKESFVNFCKKYFFSCKWFEKYDFIEFVQKNYEHRINNRVVDSFIKYCNSILEIELSAYRFVNGILTPITSKEETDSIENALCISDQYSPVKTHLERSLSLLSDKVNPDYRNSIKESISAVESFCCILTGDPKASLGKALKIIENSHSLHTALKNSFNSLYGYTSDADGIRHALLTDERLQQEDAIYMLVSCSSFINYLTQKTSK